MSALTSIESEIERRFPNLPRPWHRLEGGRTNDVWRAGHLVIKIYRPERATPLFPNDPESERRALWALSGSGMAPEMLSTGPGWLAYAFVTGPIWTVGAEAVARLLGRLHRYPIDTSHFAKRPSGGQCLASQTTNLLRKAGLSLPLPPVCDVAPVRPCLVHGDAVPANIVMANDGPVLIDWQCATAADPVEDLAMFLSPAMQFLYRGRPLDSKERNSFLTSYPDQEVSARFRLYEPWLRLRMAAHCAFRAAKGDPGYAQAMQIELAGLGPVLS